jgi:hypothetical protein
MHYFGEPKFAKMISHQMHQFYSIRPKMIFGCVSKHFRTVQNVKDAKLVFRVCIFRVPEL